MEAPRTGNPAPLPRAPEGVSFAVPESREREQEEALEALTGAYEALFDRVVRYVALRTGDTAEAEDLAGEVFLRALRNLRAYRRERGPLQAWIFRIAHNLTVDYLRRRARRPTTPLQSAPTQRAPDDPQERAVLSLQMEEVRQALRELSPAQQEVIALRFFAGLSASEAGQVMGRSPGAVRELQYEALKALRRILARRYPELEGR